MAKHIYQIPLQKTLHFIKDNKTKFKHLTTDKKQLEYYKLLGKSYYYLQIEEFIAFFKINKDLSYALNTIEYFNSVVFFDEVFKSLNFMQFNLEESKVNPKDFFYAFCYLYFQNSAEEFGLFMQKTFLHYHTAFNNHSNININHKEMCHTLAKSKNIVLKESFGEDEKSSFFKISLNDKIVINENGKLIKTLRKKAYKSLFYYLIDLEEDISSARDDAYNEMQELSSV
jgi:hypothetical protein